MERPVHAITILPVRDLGAAVDEPWGMRESHLADPSGHLVRPGRSR